jgi:hypothetical protein
LTKGTPHGSCERVCENPSGSLFEVGPTGFKLLVIDQALFVAFD